MVKEIYDFIDDAHRMVRPANFPEEAPGVGMRYIQINEIKLAIINLQGRSFMQDIDDPLKGGSIDRRSKKSHSLHLRRLSCRNNF